MDPIRELIATLKSIYDDAAELIRGTVELAKAELRQAAKAGIFAIVGLTIALAMVNLAVIMLFIAAVFGIATSGMPLWASFLVVAGGLFFLALFVVWRSLARIRKALHPTLTAKSLNDTRDSLTKVVGKRTP